MIATLREPDLRRPEFAGGTPLLLPDGQAWTFFEPKPSLTRPGAWEWGGSLWAEEAVSLTNALYKILKRLTTATDVRERASQVSALAWLCLARNYQITPGQFEAIMTAGPIGEGLWGRLETLAVTIENEAIYAAARLRREVPNGAGV